MMWAVVGRASLLDCHSRVRVLGFPVHRLHWGVGCAKVLEGQRGRKMSNERERAQTARNEGTVTIFDKIVRKEIPAKVIFEDDHTMAFWDVNPQAKHHFLVIPKVKGNLDMLSNAQEDDKEVLGHLLYTASQVASTIPGLKEGYRVVINNGKHGCQSVFHLHLHVLGGQQLTWPPGC